MGLTQENLSGLPLNQEWQRLLIEMISSGVTDVDAVETMLSTALGNLATLSGPERVFQALLPICLALAPSTLPQPQKTQH